MIAWVSFEFTVRSTPRRISFGPDSVSTSTWRSRISRVDIKPLSVLVCGGARAGSGADDLELGLDGRLEPLAQCGHADLRDDLAEEPAHDEPSCLGLRDAAALQVE